MFSKTELLEKISTLNTETIVKMSTESLSLLTSNYNSSLVKELIKRGTSNQDQQSIINKVISSYRQQQTVNNPFVLPMGPIDLPEYMEKCMLNIECGMTLTEKGWIKPYQGIRVQVFRMPYETIPDSSDEESNQDSQNNVNQDAYVSKLQDRIKVLESENKALKENTYQKEMELEEQRNQPLLLQGGSTVDEMAIELLTPLFKDKNSDLAKSFYEELNGKDDIGVAEVVISHKDDFSSKLRKVDLWRILHAARKYSATDRNFDTALRNGFFDCQSK